MALHPAFADAYQRYVEFDHAGRYAEAEPFAREALRIALRDAGPASDITALMLNNLAELLREQRREAEAEPLYRQALDIYEGLGATETFDYANVLWNLGLAYGRLERMGDAVAVLARAWPLFERASDDQMTARALEELGRNLVMLRRFDEAETFYRRALQVQQRGTPPDVRELAALWGSFAELYGLWGRLEEAVWANRQALAFHETAFGPGAHGVEVASRQLGQALMTLGEADKARDFLWRSLSLAQNREALNAVDGNDLLALIESLLLVERQAGHEDVVKSLEEMQSRLIPMLEQVFSDAPILRLSIDTKRAVASIRRGDHAGASRVLRDILQRLDNDGTSDPLLAAGAVITLSAELRTAGHFTESADTGERALQVITRRYGSGHVVGAMLHDLLSRTLGAMGRLEDSLAHSRQAVGILRTKLLQFDLNETVSEFRDRRFDATLHQHLTVCAGAADAGVLSRDEFVSEAFEAAQLAGHGPAARSVWRLSARLAAGDSDLARAIRQRQDTLQRLRQARQALVDEVARPSKDEDRESRRARLADSEALSEQLRAIDATVTQRFPIYARSVRPSLASVAEVQQLLGDDEALVTCLTGENGGWLIVIRRGLAEVFRLPVTVSRLETLVARVHASMRADDILAPFDWSAAFELYQHLLAPAAAVLEGVAHLMVVPDGPLVRLPFGLLLTEPCAAEAHRTCAWLVRRCSVSVLPSASSVPALRTPGSRPPARQPFVGFGDAIPDRGDAGDFDQGPSRLRGAFLDLAEVRRIPRLPETAREVRAVGALLGADESSLFLDARATETNVKTIDLSQYRVVLFSTHSLMPGDIEGLSEPALVLTAPENISDLDDGVLTASEVAALQLDAEWVVISACNTAEGETLGVDGRPHLVNAFFHAGAKSLLVSHWPVDSDATVRFISEVFGLLSREPGLSRAEATRRAAVAMMDDEEAQLDHPVFWAPFVLMGC